MKRNLRFHYELHIYLYDANAANPETMIHYSESFLDTDYFKARTRALEMYQCWVDVLLQSLGETYLSHVQAAEALQKFFQRSDLQGKKRTFIEVRCVIDNPYKNWTRDERCSPNQFTVLCLNKEPYDISFCEGIAKNEYFLFKDLNKRCLLGSGITEFDIQKELVSLPITKSELTSLLKKAKSTKV